VELAPDNDVTKADFYQRRPERNAEIPPTHIIVKVFMNGKFMGWLWMDAEFVNRLHSWEGFVKI
jgi:hypothetical protein